MARGNQRELAREKAAKKMGASKAGDSTANKGLTPAQRNERDKAALAEKQARKAAAAAEDPDAAAAAEARKQQAKKKNKTSSSNQAMNSMLKEGLKGAKVANNEKKKVAKRKA
eukprot:FR734877.1.p1 GENE.FR734877.1~~FR734877.1.p1  ORF type:complete len:113 (+),score=25.28 FR734877.1:69-407(+)